MCLPNLIKLTHEYILFDSQTFCCQCFLVFFFFFFWISNLWWFLSSAPMAPTDYIALWQHSAPQGKCQYGDICLHHHRVWQLPGVLLDWQQPAWLWGVPEHRMEDWHRHQGLGIRGEEGKDWGAWFFYYC